MSGRLVRVGIGGLIAAGKSSLAAALVENVELREAIGGEVVHFDADDLLRRARTSAGPLRDAILAAVPDARRADGSLDSALLAARAFRNPVVMSTLEALQWPIARQALRDASRSAEERGARLLLVEAIALVRSGIAAELDGLILLNVDEEVRLHRYLERGGTAEEFVLRTAAQAGISEALLALGAIPINGSGSLAESVGAAILVLRRLCLQGESTG